jgi:Tfp pilus assembly protein PilX
MNIFRGKKSKASERGIALIVALMLLLLISAALMGMVMMSNTETNVSANFRDEQTAYFASKAGIEEVRDRLRSGAPNSLSGSIPTTALPGGINGVLYAINPASGETVAPWLPLGTNYPDTEICQEVTCTGGVPAGSWYVTSAASASTSYAATPILPWKWVRVMAKANKSVTGTTLITSVDGTTNGNRVCWTGTNEVAITNTYTSCAAANANYLPVYELTALAVTPGGSRRMTQYELSRTPFPAFPGAMIFDGAGADFGTNPHSNHPHATGIDARQGPNAGAGCPAAVNQPAIGTTDATTATNVSGQLNDPSQFTGSPAGVSPVGSTLASNPAMNLNTVDGLTKLVNMITTAAGSNVTNGTAPTNMGTDTAPVVNVVNGDVALGGSGAGILLVTGQLTENGGFSYNGLILVIGKGSVVKDGGGGGTDNGSLFLANMYTDTSYSHLIALGSNLPPGPPSMAWNGGGNALLQYDSCWIANVTQSLPYTIVAQRELIY